MPEIWTHSRITARQKCPMKEHYRYDKQLVPLRGGMALSVGSAVHKGLETGSLDEALALMNDIVPNDQEEADKLEAARAMVEAMLTGYWNHMQPLDLVEAELAFELPLILPSGRKSRKYRLAGKLDGIARHDGKLWLVEYKTASQIDKGYLDRLYVDGQITTYMYAAKRMGYDLAGVIYRVLRKPLLRRSQKESQWQYIDRMVEDIGKRPDHYYHEERLYRSTDDLQDFERSLRDQVILYEKQRKEGMHFRHTSNCAVFGTCEYLPLCTKIPGAMAMFTTKKPHSELEGD